MSLLYRSFCALLLAFVVCWLASCADEQVEATEPQPDIVGTWRFTGGEPAFNTNKDVREIYQQYSDNLNVPLTDEQLDSIEAAFEFQALDFSREGTLFEFRADGTIAVDGRSQGAWVIHSVGMYDDKSVIVIETDNRPIQFEVERLVDYELKLWIDTQDILGRDGQGPLNGRIGPDELGFGYRYVFEAP